MAETALPAPAYPRTANGRSQHLIWGVLLLAFAAFCLVCLVSGFGLYYFAFRSSVPLTSQLLVGRGTAGLTEADQIEQVVRRERYLTNSAAISTDGQSQAVINFLDPLHDNNLIAAATLKSNTRLTLAFVSRPRFDWSGDSYRINLQGLQGELDVFIPPELNRELWLSLDTPQDAQIYLTGAGQYSIMATENIVSVSNRFGDAYLVAPDERTFNVSAGQRASYSYAMNEFAQTPAFTDLANGIRFHSDNVVALTTVGAEAQVEGVWRCTSSQSEEPNGHFGIEMLDGRPVLHLWRPASSSHAETFCYQPLGTGQGGLDVSGYDYLALRSTFKIGSHSLSLCGVEGSECPLMLRMDYIPASGDPATAWYHGFFAYNDPSFGYPSRCVSCTQDHEVINQGVWYNYDSGNLFALIPPNQRPKAILNLRFYASGHQYDVYVRQMSLLAGTIAAPAP